MGSTRDLTFDQIIRRKDEPATEPVPRREDIHEHVFQGKFLDDEPCRKKGSSIHLRVKGSLTRVQPVAGDGGRLSIDELQQLSDAREPDAHRPRWLDIMYAPRIRPWILDRSGPMQLLIFESIATEWPWCAIGKLWITRADGSTKVGSGVLVGPNLLLTASHAMPWGTEDSVIRFVPNYRGGEYPDGMDPRFGESFVERWRGVPTAEGNVTGTDYVICKVDWRIGDRTGWLGSRWTSDEGWYSREKWISVGYPTSQPNGGERPSMESPIDVVDSDSDGDGLEIETHKFALGGWSGGPLWGWRDDQPVVVGIESGFEKDVLDPTRTVFAGGRHMVDLVKYGWANWT